MANELGQRNVAFEVDDLQVVVEGLAADGYGLVGGIGQYENAPPSGGTPSRIGTWTASLRHIGAVYRA